MSEQLVDWLEKLQQIVSERCPRFHTVIVEEKTTSTQDAAKDMGAQPGWIITTLRQTEGRGQWGKKWADTGFEGVAVTFVWEAEEEAETMVRKVAAGVAMGIEVLLGQQVGIKPPNDILVGGRKLAGILVEQGEGVARIGIGINVLQTEWPQELRDRAVSMKELGCDCSRLEVLAALLPSIHDFMIDTSGVVTECYKSRKIFPG